MLQLVCVVLVATMVSHAIDETEYAELNDRVQKLELKLQERKTSYQHQVKLNAYLASFLFDEIVFVVDLCL